MSESWNGTCWANENNLTNAQNYNWGVGVSTAAMIGGYQPSPSWTTQQWNGTCWTLVQTTTVNHGAGGAAGTTTSAIAYGGDTPAKKTNTESWDGTSWATANAMGNARNYIGSGGTAASALGINTQPGTACEEWADPVISIKTVTVS
jgi:hypothetical protein